MKFTENRTVMVAVRFTPAEAAELDAMAEGTGKSRSEIVRDWFEDAKSKRRDEVFAGLLKACEMGLLFVEIADDWNMDEAEIDGEMIPTWDVALRLRTAIARAKGVAE